MAKTVRAKADIRDLARALNQGLRERHQEIELHIPRLVARRTLQYLIDHWDEVPRVAIERHQRLSAYAIGLFTMIGAGAAVTYSRFSLAEPLASELILASVLLLGVSFGLVLAFFGLAARIRATERVPIEDDDDQAGEDER